MKSALIGSAWLFLLLTPMMPAQEITFENLDFEYVHNSNLTKADLVEKVLVVHFWGVT